MKTIIHKATAREHHQCAWRSTFYSFGRKNSGNTGTSEHIDFGTLSTLNAVSLNPNRGLETHEGEDMAVIMVPLSGKVKGSNDRGDSFVLTPGEILFCIDKAGTMHTEYNPSLNEANNYLKIGISLNRTTAQYYCRKLSVNNSFSSDALTVFLSPESCRDRHPFLPVQAWLSAGRLKKDSEHLYTLRHPDSFGVYFFVIEGRIIINGSELSNRDGQGVYGTRRTELKVLEESVILAIEVPVISGKE